MYSIIKDIYVNGIYIKVKILVFLNFWFVNYDEENFFELKVFNLYCFLDFDGNVNWFVVDLFWLYGVGKWCCLGE